MIVGAGSGAKTGARRRQIARATCVRVAGRAALRGYLGQLARGEALLSRVQAVPRGSSEEAVADGARAARRARHSKVPA